MADSSNAEDRPRQLTLTELNKLYPLTCSIDKKTRAVSVPVAWTQANLVTIEVKPGMHVRVHKDAAPVFRDWFEHVARAGLASRLLVCNGGYYARLKRGPGVAPIEAGLSRHARGIAVDFNAEFNPMGKPGPKLGEMGCLDELVPLAHECGLVWGGDWHGQSIDPMHFEVGA